MSDFELRRPDTDRIRPISWAWQGRVPIGAMSLFVGDEGVGKGTLQAWLIARWTRGELPGDLYGKPSMVVFVGDEDGFDDVVTPRLLGAGADLDYVRELPASDALGALDVKRDRDELGRLVDESGARVLVFDQLLDNLPQSLDAWKGKQVRQAIAPLRKLARERRFAVVATLHTNKGRGGSFRDKVADSQAFNAVSRSSLLVAKHLDDLDRTVVARGKGNLAKRPASLEFDIESRVLEINGYRIEVPVATGFEESDIRVEDLLGAGNAAEPATARDEAAAVLRDILADGPVSATEATARAIAAGISERTLSRAKSDLGVKSDKDANGWVWSLTWPCWRCWPP